MIALAGVDLGLPVERQVIGVFGDQHLGDRRLGRQAALDQPRRRGRLHHDVLASPAGVFGPAHDQHPELRRHDVEALAHVLADPMQRAPAAGAGMIVDIDHHLDARQMCRQRSAVHPALGGADGALGRCRLFALGLGGGNDLLGLFQSRAAIDLPAASRPGGRSGGAASP